MLHTIAVDWLLKSLINVSAAQELILCGDGNSAIFFYVYQSWDSSSKAYSMTEFIVSACNVSVISGFLYVKISTRSLCTMMNSFLSLSGDCGPSWGNQHHGTSPGGRHLHVGEGSKLSGSIMAKNALKLCLATPFIANNKVNPVPLLSKVLETAQMFDPNSCLKASNPALSPITKSSKIPKDEKIFKYAFDLQTLATKQ